MAILICISCKKSFYTSHKNRSKYCARKCYDDSRWLIPTYDWLYQQYCIQKLSTYDIAKLLKSDSQTVQRWLKCYKIKVRSRSEARGLIADKISNIYKGKMNPNWKGGISSKHMIIRGSKKYRRWRQAVFERDNHTCQKCSYHSKGKKKGDLEAHHIKSFIDFPALRFVIKNGITLCEACHHDHHFGKKNE